MIRGSRHITCEERLRHLSSFSFKRKRLKEDLTIVISYLMCVCGEDGAKFFSNVQVEGQQRISYIFYYIYTIICE